GGEGPRRAGRHRRRRLPARPPVEVGARRPAGAGFGLRRARAVRAVRAGHPRGGARRLLARARRHPVAARAVGRRRAVRTPRRPGRAARRDSRGARRPAPGDPAGPPLLGPSHGGGTSHALRRARARGGGCMKVVIFCHSLVSDWNHGNAHFLRGVTSELLDRGHEVSVYEPVDAWSRANLIAEHGHAPEKQFAAAFPELSSTRYDLTELDLDDALDGAGLV